MLNCHWLLTAVVLSTACAQPGAVRESERALVPTPPATAVESESANPAVIVKRFDDWVAPYPRGRWRLAHPAELERSLLWVSHILIRHRDVSPSLMSFRPTVWRIAPPVPERTRPEALALAQSIANEARANHASFASLAAMYSEDVATRDHGGALGGVLASYLFRAPEILDALAVIRPSEVSAVVESIYGFHIVFRQMAPLEEHVSGARLVVGYDEAPWLSSFLARGSVPSRSREYAVKLANEIAAQAAAAPDGFERLVERYSESVDALRRGDLGTWSTREPMPLQREFDVIRGLPIGGVAVLDSMFGVEVLKRTPNRPRERYAARLLCIPFARLSEEADPNNISAVQLKELAARLGSDPSTWAKPDVASWGEIKSAEWWDARGVPQVEDVVRRLRVDETHGELLRINELGAFVVVQRIQPTAAPPHPPPIQFDLPTPSRPDVEWLVRAAMTPRTVHRLLAEMGTVAVRLASARPALKERLIALHSVRRAIEVPPESLELLNAVRSAREQTRELLGNEAAEQYERDLQNRVEGLILDAPPGTYVVDSPA